MLRLRRAFGAREADRYMRIGLMIGLAAASLSGGCAYWPTPADPIRVLSSPADVSACRRLGSVGRTRTDGVEDFGFAEVTNAPPAVPPGAGLGPPGPNFGARLELLEAAALRHGATDLLLRRTGRDWSYVDAIAYRCRR